MWITAMIAMFLRSSNDIWSFIYSFASRILSHVRKMLISGRNLWHTLLYNNKRNHSVTSLNRSPTAHKKSGKINGMAVFKAFFQIRNGCLRLCSGQNKVTVISKWLYQRRGRKVGFYCNYLLGSKVNVKSLLKFKS